MSRSYKSRVLTAIRVVCDNYSTHKSPTITKWIEAHPRFHLNFTPSDLAMKAVQRRAGGMLDPVLVALFNEDLCAWLTDLSTADVREIVLATEPRPHATVLDPRLVAEVFADLADLKSPYLLGHSRAVSALAGRAAAQLRLPEDTRKDLEMAGLLHDVGRVAVSNAVWDKPGRLSSDEWERV